MTTHLDGADDRGIGPSILRTTPIPTTPERVRARRLARLNARATQAQSAFLEELAQFTDDEIWRGDGSTDMVSWLTSEFGILPETARSWSAVAELIGELPVLRNRFAEGAISLDQLVALSEIATSCDGVELAVLALSLSAAEIAGMAGAEEPPPGLPVDDGPGSGTVTGTDEGGVDRTVRWSWNSDDRFLDLEARLPGIEGVIFERAMLRMMSHEKPDPVTGIRMFPERAVDALVALVTAGLAPDGDVDRAAS